MKGPAADVIQPLPIQSAGKTRRSSDVQGDEDAAGMMDYGLQGQEGLENVFESLKNLKQNVENIKFPLGSQEHPARTCKDLELSQPDFPDGMIFKMKNMKVVHLLLVSQTF